MNIAKYIDHTLLKPEATRDEIQKLCEEAKKYRFYAVCVNPNRVAFAAALLKGSGVKVAVVVGFPLGTTFTSIKTTEAMEAVALGADEIDMVLNIGALKDGDIAVVEHDIGQVVAAVSPRPVKVILETSKLSLEEIVVACNIAKKTGAAFVKTCTGFGGGSATVEHIKLMRKTVGPDMGVKASGGIKDYAAAKSLIDAGATRLGCSASVAIMEGALAQSD